MIDPEKELESVFGSYLLLKNAPEKADDRHKDKIATNSRWSYYLLRDAPEQCNDAIREKAKEWKDDL